ncbi:MAG: hypothetical protein LBS05_03145 [Tannerellaceae bacterium]|nr:hypothetical protein [Tannerellaceae bacterium]
MRTYLIHFKSIGTTTNLPQYETIEKIKDEHRKLTEILNWIDGKIL